MLTHQLTSQVKLLHKVALVIDSCESRTAKSSLDQTSFPKLLILKRGPNSYSRPKQWDLPGGNAEWPFIDKDTSNSDLLAKLHRRDIEREVLEETGIDLSQTQNYTSLEFDRPILCQTYFDKKTEVYSIILGWLIRLFDLPKIILSDEHTDFAWIEMSQFREYDFGFAGEPDGFIRIIIERALNSNLST